MKRRDEEELDTYSLYPVDFYVNPSYIYAGSRLPYAMYVRMNEQSVLIAGMGNDMLSASETKMRAGGRKVRMG